MAENKKIKIELTGDTSDVDAKVEQMAQGIEQKVSDTSKRVSSEAEQMGKSIQNGLGLAFVQVAQVIDQRFTEAIRTGFQEMLQIDRYTTVVQRTAKSFTTEQLEKFIGQLQRLTGISDTELRQALMTATLVTGDLNKAFEAVKLGANIGATGLMGTVMASRAIAQAMTGVTYGLTLLARTMGIVVPKGASTAEIMAILRAKLQDLAEEIHSKTSGSLENLQLELGDLKDYIGRLTIQGMNPFIIALDKAVAKMNDFIGAAIEGKTAVGAFLSGFLGSSAIAVKGFSIAGNLLNKFVNLLILAQLVGKGGWLAKMGETLVTTFGTVAGTIATITGGLAVLVGELFMVYNWLKNMPEEERKRMADTADKAVEVLDEFADMSIGVEHATKTQEDFKEETKEVGEQAEKTAYSVQKLADAYRDYARIRAEEKKKPELVQIITTEVSPEVEMAHRLIGLEGYERERARIRMKYQQKIDEANKQGRVKEAQYLKDLMNDELREIDKKEAEEKRREDERLREKAERIRDYIATAKMSEEEKAKYELEKEIQKYEELVRRGKLTEDELAQYKKLKLEEIFKERQKKETSWAQAQLVGVTGKWFQELTGMAFTQRVQKLNLIVDVNLRGAKGVGIDETQARMIGNAIVNSIRTKIGAGGQVWQ